MCDEKILHPFSSASCAQLTYAHINQLCTDINRHILQHGGEMKSAKLNLIAEPNETDGEKFNSKNRSKLDAGTRNPPHLSIVHSPNPESQTSERLSHFADCSKALEIIAKLHRQALDLSRQKAQAVGSVEVPSRSNNDSLATQNSGKVAKDQLSKPSQNRHVVYEERKRQWDQRHPNAKPEQRDAAITRIARECGV